MWPPTARGARSARRKPRGRSPPTRGSGEVQPRASKPSRGCQEAELGLSPGKRSLSCGGSRAGLDPCL
ncbi:hypothetical protein Celaphus_00007853 [Cervus elaphus hippelaphus]|uniref:Uncharacterized protein n=1 Tax=Cervus elaphus hippelaphus TaxID=46360 RepID=A0A212CB76_CEREH|nr:hypothetical protein Celaphus_00007853 [Cervus elaphus hippelaphus]